MHGQSMFIKIILCTLYVICVEFALANGHILSQVLQENRRLQNNLPFDEDGVIDTESLALLDKRACKGFPCMYSHLGTKAGKASLYKTLAGFIDDCFNDANCDPGRRKRQNTKERIHILMDTPLSNLLNGINAIDY